MIKKSIICLVLLFLLSGLASPLDGVSQSVSPDAFDSIFVTIRRDSAPYYFISKEGAPSGWLVDLWELWSQKSGIDITFSVAKLDDSIKLVRNGGADVHAGLRYSPERAKLLDFVMPIVKASDHVFYHKSILSIRTLDDLKAFRVGVIKDSSAFEFFTRELPEASLVIFPDNASLFNALNRREIRIFAMDNLTARHLLQQRGMLSDYHSHSSQPLETQNISVAVGKGNNFLAKRIIDGMKKITLEEQGAIERKWIGQANVKTTDILRISCLTNYVPFTMLTQTGEPAGLLIDFWRLWSEKTGQKIEFLFGDWAETLDDLAQDRSDIHFGMFKNQRRELWVDFSSPLYPMAITMFHALNQPQTPLQDMAGQRVGVLGGSEQERYLRDGYPGINIITYEKSRDMILAAAQGNIQAFVADEVPALELIDQMGLAGLLGQQRQRLTVKELCAAVSKGHDNLLALINQGVSAISTREILELERRWLRDPDLRLLANLPRKIELTSNEKHWLANHPTMRLGLDPSFSPFEFVSTDGFHEGISSDYVQMITQRLGIKMSPLPHLNWPQVIQKAQQGDVDVLSCVIRTPERQKFLLFTKPYLSFPLIIVTRDDARLISDIRDLSGGKLALVDGYAYWPIIKKDHPDLELVAVANIEQGLQAVHDGRVEAFADNLASVTYAMRSLGLKDIKVAATTPYNFNLSFGVRKDWPELVPIIDRAILSIPEREREEIHNRWVNLRVEKRIDWGLIWKIVAVIITTLGAVLAVILIWNRRLATEVGQRKQAEERVQYMADNVPGAIFQSYVKKNGAWGYNYMSPRCHDFFGFAVEEVMADPDVINIHPEDKNRYKDTFRNAAAQSSSWNFTGRVITPDNKIKWFNTIAKPMTDDHDDLIFNGIMLDITERKLAEQEYMAVERRTRAMSQATHDALIMIDDNDKVAFWNPAAETMFGYRVYEAVGRNLFDLIAPPHQEEYFRMVMDQQDAAGEAFKEIRELVARRKDGSTFSVERALATFQVEDKWHTVATFRDITERKKAEMQVRKLSKAIEQNPISIVITDREGRIEYINPSFTQNTGYSDGEALGRTLALLSSEKYGPRFYQDLWTTLQTGETWQGDIISHKKNGEEFWERMFVSSITDHEGNITHFVAVKEDITDRKKDEETLLRQLDELERFSKLVVGRELRMINLKKEINDLLHDMGRVMKYKIVG